MLDIRHRSDFESSHQSVVKFLAIKPTDRASRWSIPDTQRQKLKGKTSVEPARNESKFHDDSLTPAVKSYREHGPCGPEKQK